MSPAVQPDTAQAAGAAIGGLAAYLLLVNGVAYLRNPLRGARRRARSALSQSQSPGSEIADVSALAQRHRKTAVRRLVVQMIGLGLLAYGADVLRVCASF